MAWNNLWAQKLSPGKSTSTDQAKSSATSRKCQP